MADGPGQERTLSLRAHLLLLVLGTLLPGLVLAAYLARTVVADSRAAAEARLLETARVGAARIDAELNGSVRALQGLAQSDRLTNDDIGGFHAQATSLLATQPSWSAVSLAAADGRQIANTERSFGTPLPFGTDRDSVERAARTRAPAIGNLRIGGVSGQLGFAVRVPVVRDGRVRYIVSAWITSEHFADVLHEQAAALPQGWISGVADGANALVARSASNPRYIGQKAQPDFIRRASVTDEGVFRTVSLDGSAVYAAFSRAPVSRWIAGVSAPAAVVDAAFRESLRALVALAALVLGLGTTGAYVISRRIAHDITRSAVEAEAIASGGGPSPAKSRVAEVDRLLDALRRSAALLEMRQRERDEQVARADAAREAAEGANRAKDQFLAMLGHELRNPLAPALTALELMRMKKGAPADREREVIERQIRHMARLVDDLLDVSRLRRGAIELRREPIDIGDAVARAVEMTAPLVADRRHLVEVDVPAGFVVDADRIRMAQVFSNIISNAAKYSEPGGQIALRARRDGREVVLECRDNGIGMPPELVPRVFDLFVQGERGLDRREGGLGLGLAVARTLVELHGGRIEAASDGPQHGSTFTVRLPLVAQPSAATASAPSTRRDTVAGDPRIGRVLVVDDNADALDMLVSALRTAGVDAFGASTPSEALARAAASRPDAAVLDLGLPEMNGFDLARALRAQTGGAQLRLVALTGYGQAQDMAAARSAGFDAFLVKPVDVQVLLTALAPETVVR